MVWAEQLKRCLTSCGEVSIFRPGVVQLISQSVFAGGSIQISVVKERFVCFSLGGFLHHWSEGYSHRALCSWTGWWLMALSVSEPLDFQGLVFCWLHLARVQQNGNATWEVSPSSVVVVDPPLWCCDRCVLPNIQLDIAQKAMLSAPKLSTSRLLDASGQCLISGMILLQVSGRHSRDTPQVSLNCVPGIAVNQPRWS